MPDLQGELAKLKPCNPMEKGCSFLGGIGLRYSAWKETRNWTESHVSSLYASRDLRLSAGQDLTLAGGTQASAGAYLAASAGRNLAVTALADTQSNYLMLPQIHRRR